MRLPLRRVYRAFPELDRFSDEECERFVRQARRSRPGLSRVLHAAPLVLACTIGAGGFCVGMVVCMDRVPIQPRYDRVAGLVAASWMTVGTVLFVLCAIVHERGAQRAAIRRRLASAHCSRCRYTLQGLPRESGAVTCPECGSGEKVGTQIAGR